MKARREPRREDSTVPRTGFARATRTSYQRIRWKRRAVVWGRSRIRRLKV